MSIKHIEKSFERVLYPFVRFVDRIAWLVLFGLMLMTVADVVLRKLTNFSVLGNVELTELMMVIIVFCALGQCEASNGNIKVDLLYERLSPRLKAIFDSITQLLSCLFFGFMTWSLYRHAVDIQEWGEQTMDLGLPLYPFVYVASFGCALLALTLIVKTLNAVSEAAKT